MPPLQDNTTKKRWLLPHQDRLLGFECLKQACLANPEPIHPYVLADKIGSGRGFPNAVVNRVFKKHAKR